MTVTGLYLYFLAKVVPFDEISVYRSNPRHVTKLMSRRDGLDVVIAAGTRGRDGFRAVYKRPSLVWTGGWYYVLTVLIQMAIDVRNVAEIVQR